MALRGFKPGWWRRKNMNITVCGTGYVGLVAAAGFAETGNTVYAIDIDENKLAKLRRGEIPFYEPGLDRLVTHNQQEERLFFGSDLAAAVAKSEVVFIAVGTPPKADGSADLSYVEKAVIDISKAAKGPLLVVMKSTVPVGTNTKMQELAKKYAMVPVELLSNPEFLKEGAAVDDFFKPDRVILGVRSKRAAEVMASLYAPFTRRSDRLLIMNPESAEMTKYAANCMLATRISLMNELANLCEEVGADVRSVRLGTGADRRIGNAFLFPGIGYGGSCFPKDVSALIQQGAACHLPMDILSAVHQVNARQKERLFKKITAHFGSNLKGRTLAIWGLSFKPETDDIREAPSMVTIDNLLKAGAVCQVHDPAAMENIRAVYGDKLIYADKALKALEGADALIIHTEWNEYRNPDFAVMAKSLKEKIIFDGRNLYSRKQLQKYGLTYEPIGRPQNADMDFLGA